MRILILQVERISAHSCAQDIHASNETLHFRRAETNNIMLDITPIFLRSYVVFPATTGNLNLTGKQKWLFALLNMPSTHLALVLCHFVFVYLLHS